MHTTNFMTEAIAEAHLAQSIGEVPVGAVIVKDNKIIARAHNMRENKMDPTAHAEVLAIVAASQSLQNWRLSGCDLYVTLEPCPMCAGAIVQSRIRRIYIGTFDPRAGACGSVMNVVQNEAFNHYTDVVWTYSDECSELLENFFKARR